MTQQKSYTLKCFLCGKQHTEEESVTFCLACGGPIETYHNYEAIRQKLNTYSLTHAPISALKYMAWYPIDNFQNIVSLEEGGTPLIHAKNLGGKLGLKKLYIKNEGMNPTGCFKDRGTMVEITKAKEMGATAICLASTGNMAASCAAYASAAGIPCYILVPEGTPVGKLAQTLTFGARVIQVRGSYSDCAKLAVQMAKRFGYYLAGDYTFRTEGQKSEGYEIVEQLFWKCPDYVVCPIGCGTNFHAIFKGIKEFYELGLIDRLPKLIGVQTPGCNPIVKAFEQGRIDYDIVEKPNTVASAIAAGDPLDGTKILADIYESKGYAVEVTDDFLLIAQQEQARGEGIFSEPSGALAYAAVKKLAGENFFKESDIIVCIATGNGLKDPKSPLKILPEPASVEPVFEEIEHFIENKLYTIRESGQADKGKVIFTNEPDQKAVSDILQKEFGITPDKEITIAVLQIVKGFLLKGKEVKKTDLQHILEEILDEVSLKNRVLEIKDFHVETGLEQKAIAKVILTAFGKSHIFTCEESGPVNAIITAISNGLKDIDTREIRLTDYSVEIDTRSVDASVEVKMTLFDNKGNKVVSRTNSPDIIVASVRAYEKGFNLLYSKEQSLEV